MKKGVIIILAVAIIGALGVYAKSRPSAAHMSSSAAVESSSTSTQQPAVSMPNQQSASYKDGTYTGDTENTVYGRVQVAVVVSGGKITNVNFLRMPDDLGHTQEVTAFAEPLLKNETLYKQSAHIDFVSGATQTSQGYQQSLQSALDMALQA
jgi:uncharacterized protein with FMN-binding domain